MPKQPSDAVHSFRCNAPAKAAACTGGSIQCTHWSRSGKLRSTMGSKTKLSSLRSACSGFRLGGKNLSMWEFLMPSISCMQYPAVAGVLLPNVVGLTHTLTSPGNRRVWPTDVFQEAKNIELVKTRIGRAACTKQHNNRQDACSWPGQTHCFPVEIDDMTKATSCKSPVTSAKIMSAEET